VTRENCDLQIGEVARAAGVSVEAVRFYEKQGLLPRPRRRPSGYRRYSSEAARRVRFIQAAKRVGFRLQEIGELLELRVTSRRGCTEVKARALAKLDELAVKRAELERMEAALRRLVASCEGSGPAGSCPLLDALEADAESHADR
jgi:MerR family copper efflux transcriptional regulator